MPDFKDLIERLRLRSVGLTVDAAIDDLIRSTEKPSRDKIEKIVKTYGDQSGVPGPLIPYIVFLLVKSVEILSLKPLEKELLPKIKLEKKEYEVYSYENEKLGIIKEAKKIIDYDEIELGIKDGKPYVIINGREERKFRTKYKQFANLVLLATVRKTGEAWVHKKDLDLGVSDQALSDIRSWIIPWLLKDIAPTNVIEASRERVKMIKLAAFRTENIVIDKSICSFKSKSINRVKELVNEAERKTSLWKRGILKFLLERKECEELRREASIMERQMGLVQRAVNMLGWKLHDQEWEKLSERSQEVLELCGFKY